MNPITAWIAADMETQETIDKGLQQRLAAYQDRRENLKNAWQTPLRVDGWWRAERYHHLQSIGYEPVITAGSYSVLDKRWRANSVEAGILFCQDMLKRKAEKQSTA
uniref:Uncharacterized protein n=1 Tax=Fibrocapsa japonica TaxID=94617 RepID=A0A7S2V2K2_9STRA|mmetsp:Transcript_4232/g.6319  ORF Transcript_4232/g.6319 Transcript_4232/m.6319 type:complete len:106 (+) Transcript_4232:84-401(+)|eukprot:CAMPEP_0113934162 /NCGR_PEP_ID=MMETSP1339-20121228/1498_1 /TAXON_ID=94617 /ORGANISM="Fibrocapsa japonica" /LENGTH=105 /DNA_ID=CAMNT_0000935843 /DNA_START=83 /DNA_END=400 /DNA_ORIENTATION=+ /assembly_acc=CAM_ASM_000762